MQTQPNRPDTGKSFVGTRFIASAATNKILPFVAITMLTLTILLTFAPIRAQSIVDLTPLDIPPYGAFPAPNGRQYAYSIDTNQDFQLDSICIANIVEARENCFDTPEGFPASLDSGNGVLRSLIWNHQSSRIAFVNMFFSSGGFQNSTWTLDLASGVFTRLDDPTTPAFNTQPDWSPDGTRLAVAHTEINAARPVLAILDSQTGEQLDRFTLPTDAMLGPDDLRWSPDGTQIAISAGYPLGESAYGGLWLLNLESRETRLLASGTDFETALSAIAPANYSTQIGQVLWSPTGESLLVWAGASGFADAPVWPFLVDSASGDLTPLPIPEQPIQAAWSPQGDSLLVASPTTLYLVDTNTGSTSTLTTFDNRFDFGGPSENYAVHDEAAWGEDGHAIIGGYAVTLNP